jgi:hypothetical protein
MLLVQTAWRALSRTRLKTGNRIAARMAIIAITTSNSMRVNAEREETVFLPKVQPRIMLNLPPSKTSDLLLTLKLWQPFSGNASRRR